MQPLWKTAWQFLKVLKIELAYDPVIPLSVIYSREMKTYVHTKTWIWMNVHSSITHNSPKSGNNPKGPSTDVYTSIHTMEYYSTVKRNEVLPHATSEQPWKIFCVCSVTQSCPTLCKPWTVTHQALLSMEFSRQEYWSRLPFPTPSNLYLLHLLYWQVDSLPPAPLCWMKEDGAIGRRAHNVRFHSYELPQIGRAALCSKFDLRRGLASVPSGFNLRLVAKCQIYC